MLKALFHSRHGRLEETGNLFTPLRMLFAIMVLYSHALMIILGKPYLSSWSQFADFAAHRGLDGFFILSGYMLTASVLRSDNLRNYSLARVLRIFPGLIVTVLLLWLVVGPLLTSLSLAEYWSHGQTWAFPLLLISQADPLAGLPGLFEGSPVGGAANGPLWTIRYELLCYLALGGLVMLGLFKSRTLILVWATLAVLGGIVYAIFGYSGPGDATLSAMARFAPAFMIGAGFYAGRDHIPLAPGYIILAIAAALASYGTALFPIMLQIATAWAALALGYVRLPEGLHNRIAYLPDLSYGIYILHWPLGMIFFALMPGLSTTALFALMLPAAILAGWALRVTVENPAEALKRRLVKRPSASAMPARSTTA